MLLATISSLESTIIDSIYGDTVSAGDITFNADIASRLKQNGALSRHKTSIGSCNKNISS